MDAPWVVLLSTVIPALIVLAGRYLDRRRGVPADVDSAIDSHVSFVMDALKEEIAQRKESEAECRDELATQRDERVKERDEMTARIESLENDKDALQAQVNRLLLKLNGNA